VVTAAAVFVDSVSPEEVLADSVSPEEVSPEAALEEVSAELVVSVVVVPDDDPLHAALLVLAALAELARRVLDAVLAFFALAVSAGSCPEASWTYTTMKTALKSAAESAATERRMRRARRRIAAALARPVARAASCSGV